MLLRGLFLSVAALVLPAASASADSFSLSYVGSMPEPSNDFVERTLGEALPIAQVGPLAHGTDVYWALDSMGLGSVDAYGVVTPPAHTSNTALILDALDRIREGSERGIVLTDLGPLGLEVCAYIAAQTGFVFIIPSGNSAYHVEEKRSPTCDAGNILTVGALAPDRQTLDVRSNFGSSVNFAAPASFDGRPNPRLLSPLIRKLACAFASVAEFATDGFSDGYALARSFEESLPRLEALEGLTSQGQALLTCPDEKSR